jgi:TfoX/Sxy family transcriptional regulator of competence genes
LAPFAVVDQKSRVSWDDVPLLQREAFDMPADANMEWEKSSEDLVELFSEIAPNDAGVEQKKMFGWPCCFLNGNLFAGLHKQSMIFRLSERDQAIFLKLKGAAEFEPMPGRKMKGYVILENPLARHRRELAHWISRSLVYASSLPAKSKKAAKPAAKRVLKPKV